MATLDHLLRAEVLGGSTQPLFLHQETLDCISSGCIVCSYKLLVRLPHSARKTCIPNERPEQCLRCLQRSEQPPPPPPPPPSPSPPPPSSHPTVRAGLYPASGNILIIGDGDLSFSLALCHRLSACRSAQQPHPAQLNVVATTYLTKDQLHRTYPATAGNNLQQLKKQGVVPVHNVDATLLGMKKCPLYQRGLAGERTYHRVIWNFPCVHSPMDSVDQNQRGRDGQNEEMESNKKMLEEFFNHVVDLLIPGGEVHVVHKTKPPYNQWEIAEQVGDSGMQLKGAVVFDREMYPGYINRKALVGKGSFPISDARTYVFVAPMAVRPSSSIHSIVGTLQEEALALDAGACKEGGVALVSNALLVGVCRSLEQRKSEAGRSRGKGRGSTKKKKRKRG